MQHRDSGFGSGGVSAVGSRDLKPAELVRMYEHQREEVEVENKALRREVKALGEALVQREKQLSEAHGSSKTRKSASSIRDQVITLDITSCPRLNCALCFSYAIIFLLVALLYA